MRLRTGTSARPRRPCPQPEGASCGKPFLLPASILGITDIRVKGTLTDSEPRQARNWLDLRRSRQCYGAGFGQGGAAGGPVLWAVGRTCLAILIWLRASADPLGADGVAALDRIAAAVADQAGAALDAVDRRSRPRRGRLACARAGS